MSDTLKIIKCPACNCEMTKVFIADKAINVDVCANGCGGIFFDNQEIREFSDPCDNISEIKAVLEGKEFEPIYENISRVCPACGTSMTKTVVLGIQIDTCYNCGGIFLDYGEFELVRSAFKKRVKRQVIDFEKTSKNFEDVNQVCQDIIQGKDNEQFIEDSGFEKFSQVFFGRKHRYGFLNFLSDLFANPDNLL